MQISFVFSNSLSILGVLILINLSLHPSFAKVVQLGPLPNLYLTSGQITHLNPSNYFSGFNLTFSNSIPQQKYSVTPLQQLPYNKIVSTKVITLATGNIVSILADNTLVGVLFWDSDNSLTNYSNYDLAQDQVSFCYDLEFFNESLLILDCVMSSKNYYIFYNFTTQSVLSTVLNPKKYPASNMRRLTLGNGVANSQIVSYVKNATNWQVNFLQFDMNLTSYKVQKLEAANTHSFIMDIKTTWNKRVVMIGSFGIKVLNNSLDIISQAHLGILFTKIAINKISNMSVVTVTSNDSVYDFVLVNHGNLTFYSRYSQTDCLISNSGSLDNFVVSIKNMTMNVFLRGYPSYRNLFLQLDVGMIPSYVLSSNNSNTVFLINNSSMALYNFSDVIWEFVGTSQSSLKTLNINVVSLNNTDTTQSDQNLSLYSFQPEDSSIISFLDPSPYFMKNYDEPIEIYLDDYFLGPNLHYSMNITSLLTSYFQVTPTFEEYRLNFSCGFAAIFFDESQILRIFLQPSHEPNVFEFNCNISYHKNILFNRTGLNCALVDSTDDIGGKVVKIYDEYPNYDTFFIKTSRNKTQAYITLDSDIDTLMKIAPSNGTCDAYFQSNDNLLESNIFCSQGNVIYVYVAKVFDISHIINLEAGPYLQILTDRNFPGLLFVSNHTSIMIVETFFYGKQATILACIEVDAKNTTFNFIVTSDFLVIIRPKTGDIIQYNIKRPVSPRFSKKYSLFGYKLRYSTNSIAYSIANEFLYIMATANNSDYILCFHPSNLGNSDLKYSLLISEKSLDLDSYIISVSGELDEHDYLLVVNTHPWSKIFLVKAFPSLQITHNFITDLSLLYTEVPFTLNASNVESEINCQGNLVIVNSMRQIISLAETGLFQLKEPGQKSFFTFKPSDYFNGPAFNITLYTPFPTDNLNLRSTVSTFSKTDLSMLGSGVIDAFRTRHYVALLTANYSQGNYYIELYNVSHFPSKESWLYSVFINESRTNIKRIECFSVKISTNQQFLAVDCFDIINQTRFLFVQPLNNSIGSVPYYPLYNSKDRAHFTLVDNFIFYVTKSFNDAISVLYCNTTGKVLEITQKHSIPKSDLFINYYDNLLFIDGTPLPNNEIGLIVATGKTGFNLVLFNSEFHRVTYLPNYVELFAEDYLKNYNDPPVFSVIKILNVRHSATANFEVFMLAENAFAYSVQLQVDIASWSIVSAFTNYGLIRYQFFMFRPKVIIADYGFFLIADYISGDDVLTTNFFYYDISQKPASDTKNKLYDATNILTAPYYNSTPGIVLNQQGNQILYIVTNNVTDTLNTYAIRSSYLVSTTASHLTSSYMDIVASNGVYNATHRIEIQNYTAVLQGTSSLVIVIIVFGVLTFLFCVLMIVRKVFSTKGKKLLKDFQNTEYDFKHEIAPEDSSYYRVGDE